MGSGSDDASWNVVMLPAIEWFAKRPCLLKHIFTREHFDCIIKVSMCTGEGYL